MRDILIKLESERGTLAKLRGATRQDKIFSILGSYDLEISAENIGVLRIGRGSVTAIPHLEMLTRSYQKKIILNVGRFCEFGSMSSIFLGGEHSNDKLINLGLGWHSFLSQISKSENSVSHLSKGIITIGNNVVVSAGARILSGVSIADGVVIGANSLVSKDLHSPFGIYAGNPARKVKERRVDRLFPWWNLPLSDILEHNNKTMDQYLTEILKAKSRVDDTFNISVCMYLTGYNHIEFKVRYKCLKHKEHEIPNDIIPKEVSDYFRQIEDENLEYFYSPNIFRCFDLQQIISG